MFSAWTAFLLLYACGGEPEFVSEKSLTEAEKSAMVQKEIEAQFPGGAKEPVIIDSLFLLSSDAVYQFYNERNYAPFWVNHTDTNRLGSLMMGVLDSAWSYGFDPSWFYLPFVRRQLDSCRSQENYAVKSILLAKADVLLTNAFFLQTTFLAEGFIDTANMSLAWKIDSLEINPVQYLSESTAENLVERVYAFQPDFIEYRQMQKALSGYVRSTELWTANVVVPDPKKDSLGFWTAARISLKRFGVLDTLTEKSDSLTVEALKVFQAFHKLDADGKPGKQSVWALQLSNYDRFLRAALAMEKWRWKVRDQHFQFRINIPSYELHVLRNDSIVYRARVVVGTPDHQTPELRASVRYFTLFPYWNVPHSIATEEILPFVKRDTNYLHKHHYRIFDLKKNPVSIADVNWKRLSKDYFPYRIRQEGGTHNSLGLIVYYFPNKYDVYLHDTPAKNLFKREVRNFSHGCMRLQDPFRLGELIWEQYWPKDTVTADTLRNWAIEKAEETRYNIRKPIPIEIDYISVTADSVGSVFFHYDVYNRDEKYLDIIRRFGKKIGEPEK